MSSPASNPAHLKNLEEWLQSYKPETLFDKDGGLLPELKDLVPPKHLRMGTNPLTNPVVRPLVLPDFGEYGIEDPKRGAVMASDTTLLGVWLRDVIKLNEKARNFRIFGPDETASNRLHAVYEATSKQWMGEMNDEDDTLAQDGRVMEMLSEHQCEGWLEGYLLTGRHGLLSSYEAFIHIITSMVNQHQKWYKTCREIDWRNELASLNILLSSHVWRQDHNGSSHRNPGFIGHIATKKPEIVRIYLPPDANCLLSVMHHCLASKHYINVVTAGKHPAPQWLTIEEATQHCTQGIGIWEWASNDKGAEPDIIMACAGDVPTLEALAAVTIIRKRMPNLKIRFVNVVDLMKLSSAEGHPHGMNDGAFDSLFTKNKPVIFVFHAYAHLIEKLVYRRTNRNILVKGFQEEGTISTPFDMTVMNELDRFHLVMDACDFIESDACSTVGEETRWTAAYARQDMQQLLVKHKNYVQEFGVEMDEISEWTWDVEK